MNTSDWAAFCERVNQNENGAAISVHKMELNGAKLEIAKNVTFERMDFGRRDDCNDGISVRLSGNGASDHTIIEPMHIKLAESENGTAFQSVIIEAEDGVTILTFHPVLKAVWLKDLKLQ
ncbi:MAG TPA: DUF5335 family protein [Verrucomicrobiae bacterium]|nr:DUF5335 family protein [Verrucomicrobiae bacterium]